MKEHEQTKLHFHYSRSERLEAAPEAVRELNEALSGRPTLLKTLVPNRSSAYLLLAIIMLSATLFVTRFLVTPATHTLAGHRIEAAAVGADGQVHLVITRSNPAKKAPPGLVLLSIQDPEGGAPLARELVFSHLSSEQYRVSFPGEAEQLALLFVAGEEHLVLRLKVKRARD